MQRAIPDSSVTSTVGKALLAQFSGKNPTERAALIQTGAVQTSINALSDNNEKMALTAALHEGLLKWAGYDSRAPSTFRANMLDDKKAAPGAAAATATMNCWEAIAHLALQAGLISYPDLRTAAKAQAKDLRNATRVTRTSEDVEWTDIISEELMEAITALDDDESKINKPAKTALVDQVRAAARAKLKGIANRVVTYPQNNDTESHFAFCLSETKVASLNVEGQPLKILDVFDLDGLLGWGAVRMTNHNLFQTMKGSISFYEPPWETEPPAPEEAPPTEAPPTTEAVGTTGGEASAGATPGGAQPATALSGAVAD